MISSLGLGSDFKESLLLLISLGTSTNHCLDCEVSAAEIEAVKQSLFCKLQKVEVSFINSDQCYNWSNNRVGVSKETNCCSVPPLSFVWTGQTGKSFPGVIFLPRHFEQTVAEVNKACYGERKGQSESRTLCLSCFDLLFLWNQCEKVWLGSASLVQGWAAIAGRR